MKIESSSDSFIVFFLCCTWNVILWELKIFSFGKMEIKPKFNFLLPSCVKIHIDATTEFVNQPSFPIIDYRACNCGPGWELISWWLLLKPHSCLPTYMCKILYATKFPKARTLTSYKYKVNLAAIKFLKIHCFTWSQNDYCWTVSDLQTWEPPYLLHCFTSALSLSDLETTFGSFFPVLRSYSYFLTTVSVHYRKAIFSP